ncbi:MAG: MBL fold metallo-hydrolase [Solirubrobacteraceae bacterium]|jgi:glyoxylase-like metal-dependent hydrolase (beta-lactamase superfamily II)|nr:MBL fold metallo-hydrolase [Solirubrobacteraceae bacterium]
MEEIARNLHLLPSRPAHAFNAYLLEDVLLDAGTRWSARRLRRALGDRRPAAHALTHAHADHQGSSAALCTAYDIPLWCPAGEAEAMAGGDLRALGPLGPVVRAQLRWWAGPAHPVARTLREGDEVGGFTVLETPGHSPGHCSYWRERDRTLIAGDVLFGRHPRTGRPGLHEPPAMFTLDPPANRRAIRRLAALEPAVVCFGHGPPLRDPAQLAAFAQALPV